MITPARPLRSRALVGLGLACALLVSVIGPATVSGSGSSTSSTNPPSSPTSATVESYLLRWLNHDRALRGLRPMRAWAALRSVATGRASTLANLGALSHTAAGSLSTQLGNAGVRYYAWGEDLGYSSYTWGYSVAKSLYTMWRHSSAHWRLMMSSRYNYLGVGLAYRWSAHTTYASIVFTESPDHTYPWIRMTGASRSGTTAKFTWRAYDPLLQTHTAGFRSSDLEYRIDNGSWHLLRTGRTNFTISLYDRPRGHYYYIRARGRDRAGNLSPWSRAVHVYIP
jgi:uncharacterized protein YkwD